MSGNWPTRGGDYEAVTRAWTREGHVYASLSGKRSQILEVYATVKSPEWQAAYLDFITEQTKLPRDEREALAARLHAESTKQYEVEIFLHVDDRRANDLQKGDRSSWRLALVDEAGAEVRPREVVRDRRPRSVIGAEFPHLTAFHSIYIAKFPHGIELFGPGRKRFSLKLANAHGGVEMVWAAP
jgi:hypothetical protein